VASRRAERTALWQDSTVFQDSFFAPDSRDGFGSSEFAPLSGAKPARVQPRRAGPDPFSRTNDMSEPHSASDADEIGGVVVDAPKVSGSARH
jgi:hypothetical protein